MSNNDITITTPSGTIYIQPRQWSRHTTSFRMNVRPRVSVWGDKGVETVLDNLNNRTRRPHAEYKTHALRILAEAGLAFDGSKMQWNQYAYCRCPCSPAFVAPKQHLTYNDITYTQYDLSIMVSNLGNVDYTKQGRFYDDDQTPPPLHDILIP